MALLLLHVLLRYEVTLRTYGALSTPFGKKVVWIEDPPVKEPPPESITQLGSPARAEAAAEVSTSLPGDPKVHTGAATAAEEEEPDEFLRKRRRNWARLIAKVWLEDPSLCRSCGKPLPIVAAITSPGQDDVTERILRHFQIQDPPWKRQRAARARAPPPASELAAAAAPSEPELIEPSFDDEQYFVDPPGGDDWLG